MQLESGKQKALLKKEKKRKDPVVFQA